MTFLTLQPLSKALLPAALELDQRCFGGLWTLDGYRREVESPNSELLVFVEKAEGTGQRAEGVGEAREQEHTDSTLETQNSLATQRAHEVAPSELALLKTQNSKLPLLSPTPHTPYPTSLLGLGCYWAILEEAHITMLAIDPAYQRQGLGQAMLCALMASAHQRGLERATLEVRLSNRAARSLYQKFDFREAGRRQRYYPDNGEDALVLWRGGLQAPEFFESLQIWQQQAFERLQRAGWQWSLGQAHSPESSSTQSTTA